MFCLKPTTSSYSEMRIKIIPSFGVASFAMMRKIVKKHKGLLFEYEQ